MLYRMMSACMHARLHALILLAVSILFRYYAVTDVKTDNHSYAIANYASCACV